MIRLCLLKPDWRLTRFIQVLLVTEYLLVELPATVLTLIAIHNLQNAKLVDACSRYIAVGAVLLPVVCIIVPGIYLFMACSQSCILAPHVLLPADQSSQECSCRMQIVRPKICSYVCSVVRSWYLRSRAPTSGRGTHKRPRFGAAGYLWSFLW